ncbi:hypothetical protein DQ244_18730 [Blastococcus sp. TBT05-19]|uniref:hypothetical protein n=1 Tax=Blastococcus sp. TBT05-19 TaxID=2250581 RepID=UPI000DE9D2AB|nr:hypothetical protein [Blastococcus sp. TBT05-19]RBY86709.1 hypothetical protein DQ244_18730 [Blastococcus sp. TBT05-19]
MSGRDPATAPRRTDLGWLRHRSLRPAPGSSAARRTTAPAPPAPAPAPAPSPAPVRPPSADLDLSAPAPAPSPPAPSSSLDLSAPSAPAPTPSPSLDLSAPSEPVPPASSGPAGLLDLFPEAPAAAPPAPAAGRRRAQQPARPVPRLAAGGRVILTPQDPTVTLNRLQSGIGALTVEAVCSPAVGDVSLGALYELTDGTSSIVERLRGLAAGPPGSPTPVLRADREEFEQLVVDLHQSRDLRRVLVYATSESGRELDWGGTLITRTFGGARLELPLDLGVHRGPVALLSVYVIDGEFVLRAETEKIAGAVRDVARAYGYERITWADDRTPVV